MGVGIGFNMVCEAMLPEPRPTRAAVRAILRSGFLVEIEMRAAKGEG